MVEATTGSAVPSARFSNCMSSSIEIFAHNVTANARVIDLQGCSGMSINLYCNDTMSASVSDDGGGSSGNSFIGYCRGSVSISGSSFTPDSFVRYVTTKQS